MVQHVKINGTTGIVSMDRTDGQTLKDIKYAVFMDKEDIRHIRAVDNEEKHMKIIPGNVAVICKLSDGVFQSARTAFIPLLKYCYSDKVRDLNVSALEWQIDNCASYSRSCSIDTKLPEGTTLLDITKIFTSEPQNESFVNCILSNLYVTRDSVMLDTYYKTKDIELPMAYQYVILDSELTNAETYQQLVELLESTAFEDAIALNRYMIELQCSGCSGKVRGCNSCYYYALQANFDIGNLEEDEE